MRQQEHTRNGGRPVFRGIRAAASHKEAPPMAAAGGPVLPGGGRS